MGDAVYILFSINGVAIYQHTTVPGGHQCLQPFQNVVGYSGDFS